VLKVIPNELEIFWHNQKKGEDKISEKCVIDDVTLLSHFKHTKFEVGDLTMIHPDIRTYFLNLQQAQRPSVEVSLPTKGGKKGGNAKKVIKFFHFNLLRKAKEASHQNLALIIS
jgi:hypothetical protein